MKIFKLFEIFLVYIIISCSQKDESIILRGNIPNLPDGTLYLYQDESNNRIDSTKTENGIFVIKHQFLKNSEPVYLGLDHIDKLGIKRLIDFPTNAKYRGSGWNTSLFLSDATISINGNIKDENFNGIKLAPSIKLVSSPKILGGKQTEAYYNTDGDLFENINSKTIQTIREKIKQYPYSYHLLYKIDENKNSFSADQVADFSKLFKGEITQSETYKKLYAYNQKKFMANNINLPLLENEKGEKKAILDSKYNKHLIIFWASWCGPCRTEIPLLKTIYIKEKDKVEFISISTDTDKKSWAKALNVEKMDWKQLIVNQKDPSYENLQIKLKLNQAIPYSVLVDNNLKILGSSLGLSTKSDLLKLINTN